MIPPTTGSTIIPGVREMPCEWVLKRMLRSVLVAFLRWPAKHLWIACHCNRLQRTGTIEVPACCTLQDAAPQHPEWQRSFGLQSMGHECWCWCLSFKGTSPHACAAWHPLARLTTVICTLHVQLLLLTTPDSSIVQFVLAHSRHAAVSTTITQLVISPDQSNCYSQPVTFHVAVSAVSVVLLSRHTTPMVAHMPSATDAAISRTASSGSQSSSAASSGSAEMSPGISKWQDLPRCHCLPRYSHHVHM